MNEPAIDILVVGDLLTDVLVRPLASRAPASDTPSRIEERPGGQGANQASWLAAEGCRVGLVARVARGDLRRHDAALRARSIRPFLVGDDRRPSGRIVVLIDPTSGERDMFSDRGAGAALEPADLTAGLAAVGRWVHVSGYALFGEHGGALMAAVLGARRRGVRVSVDPASTSELARSGVDRFRTIVDGVDVLLPNLEEARLLVGQPLASATDAATGLLELAGSVAVTCGPDGAVLVARDGSARHVAAPTVEVVDSTGAGDAFSAGFLAACLAHAEPDDALTRAVRAAARAVTRVGAQPA